MGESVDAAHQFGLHPPLKGYLQRGQNIIALLLKYIVVSGMCGHVIDKMGHHTLVGRAVVQVKQGIVGDALMEHIAAWPMTFQQSGVGQPVEGFAWLITDCYCGILRETIRSE